MAKRLTKVQTDHIVVECIYSGVPVKLEYENLVMVTGPLPNDRLHQDCDLETFRIGDCFVPSSIADAVYSGHKFARQFGEPPKSLQVKRERAPLHV